MPHAYTLDPVAGVFSPTIYISSPFLYYSEAWGSTYGHYHGWNSDYKKKCCDIFYFTSQSCLFFSRKRQKNGLPSAWLLLLPLSTLMERLVRRYPGIWCFYLFDLLDAGWAISIIRDPAWELGNLGWSWEPRESRDGIFINWCHLTATKKMRGQGTLR